MYGLKKEFKKKKHENIDYLQHSLGQGKYT